MNKTSYFKHILTTVQDKIYEKRQNTLNVQDLMHMNEVSFRNLFTFSKCFTMFYTFKKENIFPDILVDSKRLFALSERSEIDKIFILNILFIKIKKNAIIEFCNNLMIIIIKGNHVNNCYIILVLLNDSLGHDLITKFYEPEYHFILSWKIYCL